MKKIIILILITIISLSTFSQEVTTQPLYKVEDLPKYFIQNGDTIGVIITIKQLQVLDNNTDLLELFKKMGLQSDSLNSYYISIIDDLNNKIAIQEVKIANLSQQTDEQSSMITILKEKVINKSMQVDLSEQQLNNKDKVIEGLKTDLRKANTQKVVGWSSTGLAVAIAVGLSIFFGTR